jgi:UDP-3-O-[3-hydroxymyristoyl] glucosamine N-acyltransferase
MILSNISLDSGCDIDPSTSINNVEIGCNVKIAKRCSVFGSSTSPVKIGANTYIGMNTIINGYAASVAIGKNVSIAQSVNIMADSGPNASKEMQKYYPIVSGKVQDWRPLMDWSKF